MKKRLMAILVTVFAVIFGLAVFAACGGEGGSGSGDLNITATDLTLAVGDTRVLTVSRADKTNKAKLSVNWTTTDDSVVAFNGNTDRTVVTLKGVGEGQATVTAESSEGSRISCEVTVTAFEIRITGEGVEDGKLTLLRKDDGYESKTLTAKVYSSGKETNEKVEWSSSNTGILTVEEGKLTAHGIGTATVTASRSLGNTKASVEVTVKWEHEPDGYYIVNNDKELGSAGANRNRGKWAWAGFHGDAGDPVLNGEGQGTSGDFDFSVTGNTGYRWYAVQLFYKNTYQNEPIKTAGFYKLTLTMTSSIEAKITVNETDVELHKGENSVTVYYYDQGPNSDSASISINLAVHDKYRNALVPPGYDDKAAMIFNDGTLSIRNLRWEAYDPAQNALATPTAFSVDPTTKEITVTDSNPNEKLEGYVIGFFEEGKDAPTYTTAVMKPVEGRDILTDRGGVSYMPGGTDNKVSPDAGKMFLDDSAVPAGKYTLKVKAYSGVAQYGDSGWLAATEKYTKTGAVDYKILPSYRDVDRGVGRYYGWSEWGQIDFANSSFKNDTLTIVLTGEASWYSNQLYYEPKPEEFKADHLYELTFTLSGKDGEGQDVDLNNKQFIIAGQRVNTSTGTHDYTVRFYYMGGNFTMLFGKPSPDWQSDSEDNGDLGAGTYTFANMHFRDLSDPEQNEVMYFGTEKEAVGTPGKLTYWYAAVSDLAYSADLGGTMANGVDMHSMSTAANADSDMKNSYTFDYKVNPIDGKNCAWIVRFFYKQSGLSAERYHVTLVLNSSTEGYIKINGTEVHLLEGEHEYVVYYNESADAPSLTIIMATDTTMVGTSDAGEVITIKSAKWEKGGETPLQALTAATLDAASGRVSFSDPNPKGVDHYELGLFSGNELVTTQRIESEGTINEALHSNGTYTVKLRACAAAGFLDTGWLEVGTYTVTHGSDIRIGGQQNAVDHKGEWYLWTDQGDLGSVVTLSKSELDKENKRLTVAYDTTGTSSLGYSVQLFYENPEAVTGKTYNLHIKLKLSVAGTITFNGVKYTFTAGEEKTLDILHFEKGYAGQYNEGASFIILMGAENGEPVRAAELTVSDWSLTEYVPKEGEMIPTEMGEGEIPADSKWYYYSQYGTMTQLSYDAAKGSISLHVGDPGNWYSNQIFYNSSAFDKGGSYTFSVKVHTSVAGAIRVNGKVVDLEAGDNTITVEGSNGMFSVSLAVPGPNDEGTGTNWDWGCDATSLRDADVTFSDFKWTAGSVTYGLNGINS